ncbi:hypothetical protein O0L34_g12054 [Tuta absoluta]|nr:hypothetical protein O0L34_g12054 [Tuta absoluta]
MTSCGACDGKIQDLNFMECSNTKCGLLFCLLCLNKSTEEFNQLSDNFKAEWLCPQCTSKIRKGDHTPVRSGATGQLNDTFTKNINVTRGSRLQPKPSDLHLERKDVVDDDPRRQIHVLVEEIRHLRNEVKDLKESNLELKNSMHNIEAMLITTTTNLAEETAKVKKMKEDIVTLQDTVTKLTQTNAILEQEHIRNELEIIGIPEENSENLGHIVMMACSKIGVELKEDEIDDIFRAGPKQRKLNEINRSRPVVVRLVRLSKRDAVLKAARARRNIAAKDVVEGAPGNIFFNERLTKENRILFREARLRSSAHNFRYCWTQKGNIFVRRSDGRPAIRITNAEDLDTKIGPIMQNTNREDQRDKPDPKGLSTN